jgi:hypothetical protein
METIDLFFDVDLFFDGDSLRKMRTRLQMSVTRLAGISGLVEAQIRFLEEGGNGCSIQMGTVVQILRALKFLLPHLHAPILSQSLFLGKSGYGKVVDLDERRVRRYEMRAKLDRALLKRHEASGLLGTQQGKEKEV